MPAASCRCWQKPQRSAFTLLKTRIAVAIGIVIFIIIMILIIVLILILSIRTLDAIGFWGFWDFMALEALGFRV